LEHINIHFTINRQQSAQIYCNNSILQFLLLLI